MSIFSGLDLHGHNNASNQSFDYVLQQRLGLTFAGSFYQNASGQNEKWLKGNINNYGNSWYYIDTTGSLYSWNGTAGTASGTLLANLDTLYWTQPQRLYSAQLGEVTAAMTNNVLTVTTPTDWAGHEVVELTNMAPASHQIFTLNFVNHAPVLNSIPNQTMSASGSPLNVTLGFSDADNDTLSVSSVAGNLGLLLKQSLGLRVQGSLSSNAAGQHEIWLQSTLNNWHFLKPDGTLTKWDGTAGAATGTLMATLSSSYYTNIQLLSDAQPAQQVTTGVQGNTLTVTASPNLIGQTVWILVEVADVSQLVTTMFQVTEHR